MKKVIINLTIASLTATAANAAIIYSESFETDGEGVRYNTSNFFNDGTSDHFNRTDGSDIANVTGAYTSFDGSFFWAAEDTDDDGGDGLDEKTLTITGINISGFTDISISGLFGAGNENGAGASAYDSLDYMRLNYSIDAGGEQNGIWFSYQNNGDIYNEPIGLDANFDGEQDGALLSTTLAQFSTGNIGLTGNTMDITIYIYMDAASEEVAFDNIVVSGTPVPEPSTYAAIAGLMALGLVAYRRRG